MELVDNISGHCTSIFNHCDVFGQQSNRIRWKKRKIKAITPFKVIQCIGGFRDTYLGRQVVSRLGRPRAGCGQLWFWGSAARSHS